MNVFEALHSNRDRGKTGVDPIRRLQKNCCYTSERKTNAWDFFSSKVGKKVSFSFCFECKSFFFCFSPLPRRPPPTSILHTDSIRQKIVQTGDQQLLGVLQQHWQLWYLWKPWQPCQQWKLHSQPWQYKKLHKQPWQHYKLHTHC